MLYTQINRAIPDGHIEHLRVESSGIAQVEGWSTTQPPHVTLALGATTLSPQRVYRICRPDVAAARTGAGDYAGFVYEFELLAHAQQLGEVSVLVNGEAVSTSAGRGRFVPAHYGHLFNEARVQHRDDIYGSGPPSPAVSPETVAAVAALRKKTLDFGCGSGALVRELRQRDIPAFGIELDRPEVRASVRPDVAPYIDYYAGQLPTRFADDEFPLVSCAEVLEHIPEYLAALDELFRIASEYVVITVPDASGIPALFRHATVPWHLLEATHFNFFTQESLGKLLAPRCAELAFARIGRSIVNRTHVFTSLVATCRL